MGKAKAAGPAVLTANDLLTGAIVYWSGAAWTPSADAAQRATGADAREALAAIGHDAEARNEVVGAYLVVLDASGERPVALRERQRLAGPLATLPA